MKEAKIVRLLPWGRETERVGELSAREARVCGRGLRTQEVLQDKARDALQKEWHSTRRLADGVARERSPSDGESLNRSPTVRRHRFSEAEILDGLSLDLLELALEVALAAAGVPVIGRG